ncbi:uncharacterized protein PG998_010515 [Apiospora kogelbergensis]|uniref:uncharacterized protein n=1 Tax=Apiospora kogelbergensis TaxID=1337665 RepID=UPI00312DA972
MRATTASLLGFAAVAVGNPLANLGASLDIRSPPQANGIQFLCDDFPEVCANMCWGAYCVPDHTTSLVYDKASKSKKRERRKAAGCIDNKKPGNNRCSKGRQGAKKGYNCDEYPFASSKKKASGSGDKENRCSRCVPSKENSSATLSKGYKDFCKNKAPCNFQVFFSNPGKGGDHCNMGPNQCKADVAEQCSGSINIIERREWVVEPPSLAAREVYTNGTCSTHPTAAPSGSPSTAPRALNQTLHDELVARHADGDEDEDEELLDGIVGNMVSDVDYIQEVTWEARLKE